MIYEDFLKIKKLLKGDADIILMPVGEFYETYDEQAELLAKELGITLTARYFEENVGKPEKRVKMAAVPKATIENTLAFLNAKSVVVCKNKPIGDIDSGFEDNYVPYMFNDVITELRYKMFRELKGYAYKAKLTHVGSLDNHVTNDFYKAAYDYVYATDVFNMFFDRIVPNGLEGLEASPASILVELNKLDKPLKYLYESWLNHEECIDDMLVNGLYHGLGELFVGLCCAPIDDANYCHYFVVPRSWLRNLFNERKTANAQDERFDDFEQFLEEYAWEDTTPIYFLAKKDGVIVQEKEEK